MFGTYYDIKYGIEHEIGESWFKFESQEYFQTLDISDALAMEV